MTDPRTLSHDPDDRFTISRRSTSAASWTIDSEIMGFVAKLDEINALAEATPGFVWRLKTEDGDATAIRRTRTTASS